MIKLTAALAILGVSRSTMYRLIKRKAVTPVRLHPNGAYYFQPHELEKLIAAKRVPPTS